MTSELALLEASLADTQRQAMSLGSRLALAETKNDELLAQSQVRRLAVVAAAIAAAASVSCSLLAGSLVTEDTLLMVDTWSTQLLNCCESTANLTRSCLVFI